MNLSLLSTIIHLINSVRILFNNLWSTDLGIYLNQPMALVQLFILGCEITRLMAAMGPIRIHRLKHRPDYNSTAWFRLSWNVTYLVRKQNRVFDLAE